MASFTSRLAGWAAGRLKGEKARQKTMEFVDKTGVGKALGFLGDAALLGGAGKIAGMGAQAVGAKMGLGAGAGGMKAMPEMGKAITSMPKQYGITPDFGGGAIPTRSLTERLGSAASGAADYLKKRPEVLGTALTTSAAARQAAANRALDRQALAQRESQFQQEFGLRKGEQEREVERQRRIAQMLAPLFQRIAGGQG
jgi:hypothetical protein